MKNIKRYQILKCLVGSRAHGLASEDADYDYRGVYIEPSSQLLSMGYKYKGQSWVEGETEDQTSYELENFLNLAIQGHPNILEMFVAPVVESNKDGQELLRLYKHIWSPEKAYTAFMNYANNRRKNMFNAENTHVGVKSAYCHIRVLYNLVNLLGTGEFSLEIEDENTRKVLKEIKNGKWIEGDVIDLGRQLEMEAAAYLSHEIDQKQDIEKVTKYFTKMRKKYWR